MPAITSLMLPVAVLRVVLCINGRPLIGRGVLLVATVRVFAKHVRCIASSVLVVVTRRRCLSNHKVTDRCIAAIVTSRKVLVERVTTDRVGNPSE